MCKNYWNVENRRSLFFEKLSIFFPIFSKGNNHTSFKLIIHFELECFGRWKHHTDTLFQFFVIQTYLLINFNWVWHFCETFHAMIDGLCTKAVNNSPTRIFHQCILYVIKVRTWRVYRQNKMWWNLNDFFQHSQNDSLEIWTTFISKHPCQKLGAFCGSWIRKCQWMSQNATSIQVIITA